MAVAGSVRFQATRFASAAQEPRASYLDDRGAIAEPLGRQEGVEQLLQSIDDERLTRGSRSSCRTAIGRPQAPLKCSARLGCRSSVTSRRDPSQSPVVRNRLPTFRRAPGCVSPHNQTDRSCCRREYSQKVRRGRQACPVRCPFVGGADSDQPAVLRRELGGHATSAAF